MPRWLRRSMYTTAAADRAMIPYYCIYTAVVWCIGDGRGRIMNVCSHGQFDDLANLACLVPSHVSSPMTCQICVFIPAHALVSMPHGRVGVLRIEDGDGAVSGVRREAGLAAVQITCGRARVMSSLATSRSSPRRKLALHPVARHAILAMTKMSPRHFRVTQHAATHSYGKSW